jgi:hypothetical protein
MNRDYAQKILTNKAIAKKTFRLLSTAFLYIEDRMSEKQRPGGIKMYNHKSFDL